jgi:chromosome segregation protein
MYQRDKREDTSLLKLKRVDMVGFKSFCERTNMSFPGGGVAAIVGPNGCGKSNVSDAINWVLGEQSAKSLRGERMADVIFNGTRDRKPTGMAEVTLTMVDPEYEEAQEPAEDEEGSVETIAQGEASATSSASDFDSPAPEHAGPVPMRVEHHPPHRQRSREVVISRRLFRSGESEYLLNGQICRLRDIQEIFMGTGLGPNSYAIIEQGRIGQILSSKPYDRRAIIEEAAGVTRFKAKRRMAEAKLEASRQNLNRVNDILEEVVRQVNSLKRQASRARRYGEMRDELRGQLRVVYLSRGAEMGRHAEEAERERAAIAEVLHAHGARVEGLEQEQFDLSRARYEKEDQLRQRRETLAALDLEMDRARNRVAFQERQIVEIDARMKEAAAQAEQAAERVAVLESERSASVEALAAAQAELSASRQDVARLQAELAAAEAELRSRQSDLEALRAFLILMLGEVSELKNQLAQVEEYAAGLGRERERTERDRQSAALDGEQARARRSELLGLMSQQQMELATVEERKASLDARLQELAADTAATQQDLHTLRDEYAGVKARRDSLEQILSHRAYTAETVKHLFAEVEGGNTAGFRPLGILADYLEVDSAYEPQVEDFLKEELEYVVVDDWNSAADGLRLLRAEAGAGFAGGRATFLVHPPKDAQFSWSTAGSLPPMDSSKVRGSLMNHIRLNNGFAASTAALLPRLKNCYLVDSPETGRQLAATHPEYYFLAPEGECFHGYTVTGGKRTNAGPLALKRELRELTPRTAELAERIEARIARQRLLEEETRRGREEMESLRARQVEQEKVRAGSDQELKQIAQQLSRAGERLSVAALEIERVEQELSRAAQQGARVREDLDVRARRRVEADQQMTRLTAAVEEGARLHAATMQALGEARARGAALEERGKAAATALDRLDQTLASERAKLAEMEQQSVGGAAEIERLRADCAATAGRAAQAAVERQSAEEATGALQGELEAGRARMAEIEEEIRAARLELDRERERKSEVDVKQARLQSDLAHLEETCRTEMGASLEEMRGEIEAAQASGSGATASPALSLLEGEALLEAEQQALAIRDKIESLGPVNMMALEEYQEASTRHEFLATQQNDLLDSIRDTQQAIQEIDSVSRQQFETAFEAISANFQDTFRTLFGGGYGAMRMTADEDSSAATAGAGIKASEAGIDLIVQPPGKRLQNVLLLSGGEKALTALALLLAVFRYQPSPFCILDEVDAPLDEANIGRFTELVGKMSLTTQFIIITHSKKTMEAAPVLYGVTMPEPGVSRLVSVRFRENPGLQIVA